MKILEKFNIHDKESFLAFAWQFIKFGIVGLSNTAISLAVYYLFVFISKDLYMLGNVAGFVVSVLNSFYWNNKYVFKTGGKGKLLKKLGRTFVAYGGTFILSTVLLYLEVQVIGINEYLAPLINLCITIPLNFLINKFWAFKP